MYNVINRELIEIITINNYPSSVKIANAIRPVLYVSRNSSKRGKNNIPESYLNNERYFFDECGVLIDRRTDLPKLANPRLAGNPRYWVVNFQDIWNQNVTKQARSMRVDKLKDVFKPYIRSIQPITEFPIEVCINIFDTKMPVDISNKGVVYTKVIEDLLVKEGKLPDDKTDFVNCSGRCKFVKVENESDIKMEIKIYKSDNNPI